MHTENAAAAVTELILKIGAACVLVSVGQQFQ